MDIRTYRAATMHEALAIVRRELGPDAAVLHTREVRNRVLFGLLPGKRYIEVTASSGVNVPSRLPPAAQPMTAQACATSVAAAGRFSVGSPTTAPGQEPSRQELSAHVESQLRDLQAMVKQLCRRTGQQHRDLPEELFRLYTDLIDLDLNEELAREFVDRVRSNVSAAELPDPVLLRARVARLIEEEITVTGPIAVEPGRPRVAALVGPTGVGKTTTIAKLAANYRLREKRQVGLITVDTYRIAAVEQLRTYAEIIDLPMQVVSTPREMRQAVRRLGDMDLILIDTAGRSPKDEVKLQELKAFLHEASADEVHLVLSVVAGRRTLEETAERFAEVGTTALILTKLDESPTLGAVLPLLRRSRLPLSYLTDGQNVPDDIAVADPRQLARLILNIQ